ncbi:MAG: Re/Si-specific NAD(P)(+) transhydrogenase subunit alpha, partial [Aestuariivirgaceae bacterium]
MKIAVPAESSSGESRVAITPDAVKAYVKKGLDVVIEAGAGDGSFMSDEAFKEAGAKITKGAAATVKGADVVLTVRRPSDAVVKGLKKGAVVAGQLDPYGDRKELDALAKAGINAFSMELMPRITRAQSMDVLSSQANLAGYKAVVDAAAEFSRAFPMMMTAAGTVSPAKAFVMGAGVAGLQAIATARRLGAIVSATDVRAAAGEQVQSLGAKFVFVEGMADAATEGGYAKELSAEDKKKQAELVAEHIKGQDIVITTALIPGRPAPVLVTKQMVETMKPGSVIVDLAVERGGNCPLSKPGKVVDHNGVTIMGELNLPGRLAGNASALYAKNLQN